MYISGTDLENDLRAIADLLSSWDLGSPARPRQPDSASIRETLDAMASDGAPQAPKLLRYFELIEVLGLDAVSGLVSYYEACTSSQAQDWRTRTAEVELSVNGFVNPELVKAEMHEYFDFGKCLVAVAENESWGFAVDCGVKSPGPVYSFDKFGMHFPCFGGLNEMVHTLRLAYEGESPFEGDWPLISPRGDLDWTTHGE